jgi:hypothetical protein
MAEIQLGNNFDFLRHVITLRSVGRVAVLIGRGVVVGIGTAARGPAMVPYGVSKNSQIKTIYDSGDLKDGLETVLDQGADVAYGVRVLGEDYASATLDLVDSQTPGVKVGQFDAIGPGVWGNVPTFTIANGDLDGTIKTTFPGTGQTSAYILDMDDLVESIVNYVKVAGTTKTIIYTGTPDPGEVKLDKTIGSLTFATGEWPTSAQQIEVRYKFHSRKITVQDEVGLPVVYNNLMTLEAIAAKFNSSNIARFTPATGATHLPEVMSATNMAGGGDGDTITIDDWETAFGAVEDYFQGINDIVPSSVFTTACEVTEGQGDIVPLMDAFLWRMADRKRPLQGFVSLPADWTAQEMADFKAGYSNLWMTILSNGWSATERDLAPARAGQEAALPLGTSPATASNSLKGIDGLLWQWSEVERETLTYAGLEVLIKDTGVHPYVGVATDLDDNFRRTVDVRTIANCVIFMDKIVAKFLNERRTLTNLRRLENSLNLFLDGLAKQSVLDDFDIAVTANVADHNAVDIESWIQTVGHMERFYHTMNVGYWSDAVAE